MGEDKGDSEDYTDEDTGEDIVIQIWITSIIHM